MLNDAEIEVASPTTSPAAISPGNARYATVPVVERLAVDDEVKVIRIDHLASSSCQAHGPV
jgi:hypothetical protein